MKILKWLVIALIFIPLLLVVAAWVRNKAVGPVGWAEDNTARALRAKMKDPESMVVRSSYVVQRAKDSDSVEISVCGVVDGKNSFGGYTGGVRFASRSVHSKKFSTFDTYTVEMEDPAAKAQAERVKMLSAFEVVYWNAYCVDDSHPPLLP